MTRENLNILSGKILDACIAVHKEIGPGLLESVYEYALLKEFELRNIGAINRVCLELFYKGLPTGKFYEIDILVEGEIVIELKAVENMHPVFDAQMISYLKLSNKRLGFLVNFNVPKLKDGFRRFVNNF
ncbi:MAG TPA: GxxExxY protein [Flavipsychrobacter sp.]|nr:GxxExxY protein [Flavipsychrobacter sp.]